MQDFCSKLNSSPWKGIISEVGIGLEFSARLLRYPGASNTVLGVNCDYGSLVLPYNMRAVSLENAKRLANNNLEASLLHNPESPHQFGLAITGAHYPDRESHAWIALATPKWEAEMHVILGTIENRFQASDILVNYIQLFIQKFLLQEEVTVPSCGIDVLYGPGVGDFERLMLLSWDNPLVFHEGRFQRVTDYLRTYNIIYSGSFNPPTKFHTSQGACLFEISQLHFYKGLVDCESILHRIRMLDTLNLPVLITKAPRFIDKDEQLRGIVDKDYIYRMGSDSWNIFINAREYPTNDFLKDKLKGSSFQVISRPDHPIYENSISETLNFTIKCQEFFSEISSTLVRNSLRTAGSIDDLVDPEIMNYIKRHKLYQ